LTEEEESKKSEHKTDCYEDEEHTISVNGKVKGEAGVAIILGPQPPTEQIAHLLAHIQS
jgi:hypothetical protein